MSYNILADGYIKPEWYSAIASDALLWEKRKSKIVHNLLSFHADVLCLQEVETVAFDELLEQLKPQGYQGCFARKGFGRKDGCATFYKKGSFTFQGATTHFYNDHAKKGVASGHVALRLALQREDTIIHVFNTHIRWNSPDKAPEEHRGYVQVKELLEIAKCFSHVIICGDFNAEAHAPVIQQVYQAGFKDAYAGKEQPTMNKEGVVRIDYIFYSPEMEASSRSLRELGENDLLPSLDEPSDHLAISADFKET